MIQGVLLLVCTAIGRFEYNIGQNSASHKGFDISGECESDLLLPAAERVKVKDIISNGCVSRKFRKANACYDIKHPNINTCKTVPSRESCCKFISRSRFVDAVLRTMKCMNDKESYVIIPQATFVINQIYDAARHHDLSINTLICFTSIAMHNMNLFFSFTKPNKCDVSIGTICRGLLQFKSLPDYKKLCSISHRNYICEPYMLDCFSSHSINDEVHAYKAFYYEECIPNRLNRYIGSIRLLGSNEAHLITPAVAFQIRMGNYCPQNELERKILRRFRIYYMLSEFIFYDRMNIMPVIEN